MLENMSEKIEQLDNYEKIISLATNLFDIIIKNRDLSNNEKILVVDLLNAMLNSELYNVRGEI